MKLSEQAKTDPSLRSYLFENWLVSQESWVRSKLVCKLRSRTAQKKKGLRKWMFKAEMITRFGEDVALAMIEAKENDPERAEREIREHPDCPGRKDRNNHAIMFASELHATW